ncbi:hypothetical protein DRF65_14305 [Chryseobacterium pennae]|uniref:Uncharacterized protein n=2 Tax=Chryseobacterium pennae TaxID=2258962 RepID=A0A3D9C794_9FLAO|nr:hypothetical protein DRF65_14305 [Chryseobacterium pennae]
MNDTDRRNIDQLTSYKLLFLTTPILYFLILWKILEFYNFTLITNFLLFILPVIGSLFIKSKNISANNQSILQTMSYYCIPFFLAVNISFDFSKPSAKKFLIIDKAISTENKSDSDGTYEVTKHELKVVSKEKMNSPAFWKDLSTAEYTDIYPNIPGKEFITIQNKKYEILGRKNKVIRSENGLQYSRSYYLKEYVKPMAIDVDRKIYNKFGKGNDLDIETHSGLFGIEWTYYHWKM